jgi:L-alanine-DL-glutamate epimerase-like enolase superfamily enzyme
MNVKIAKSGLAESMKIAALAREHHKKLMIGCMTETMVGLSAAIFLAAGTGFFDYIDLDGSHFLFGKPTYPGISTQGPVFTVIRK